MNLKALVRPMLNRLGYELHRVSSDGDLGRNQLMAHRRIKLIYLEITFPWMYEKLPRADGSMRISRTAANLCAR